LQVLSPCLAAAPVCLELWLVVVHAVLSCQGLDEVLEGHVATHIVTHTNGALNLAAARWQEQQQWQQ